MSINEQHLEELKELFAPLIKAVSVTCGGLSFISIVLAVKLCCGRSPEFLTVGAWAILFGILFCSTLLILRKLQYRRNL